MTARAAVAEAASPPKTTTAPAERLRQPSVDAGTGACADAGAGAGACAARPREDRDVLKEEEEKEEEEEDGEEEEEEKEAIRLAELLGEFRVIEEERQEAERMERGQIRPVRLAQHAYPWGHEPCSLATRVVPIKPSMIGYNPHM